jgi:hypothetical protein
MAVLLAADGLQDSRDLVTLTSAPAIGAGALFLIGRHCLRRSPRYHLGQYEFLIAWVVFSVGANAFRETTIPAFATGIIHDLLLGLGLYLGLWPGTSGAAGPGNGLGPDGAGAG